MAMTTVTMSPRINMGNYSSIGPSASVTRDCNTDEEVTALIEEVSQLVQRVAVEEGAILASVQAENPGQGRRA
jgi:hypothetical protein